MRKTVRESGREERGRDTTKRARIFFFGKVVCVCVCVGGGGEGGRVKKNLVSEFLGNDIFVPLV